MSEYKRNMLMGVLFMLTGVVLFLFDRYGDIDFAIFCFPGFILGPTLFFGGLIFLIIGIIGRFIRR